jgi:hypothetical protein
MATPKYNANSLNTPTQSSAWVVQVWISFILSVTATAVGIAYTPTDHWARAYLGMGLMFSVGSSLSLAKTTRDIHESKRFISRIDEVKLERLMAEHGPFKK